MAIAVYFHPKGMTLDRFNGVQRLLKESGNGEPSARIHHSMFGEDGDLMVYDVWESPQAFQAFGEVPMPIIARVGFEVGEPTVMPLHRIEQVARPWSPVPGRRPESGPAGRRRRPDRAANGH